MKVYSDYIPKYNSQKTLKIISETKKEITSMFSEMFDLLEVDPKITCDINEYYTNKRIITFDNSINNQLIELTPYVNNYISKLVKDFEFEPGRGIITFSHTINRDIEQTPELASYEFIYNIHIKYLASEINDIKMTHLAEELIHNLNSLAVTNNYGIKLPKRLHVTSIDKLCRQYPIIDKKMIIDEVCNKFNHALVFQTNGDNKHRLLFLEDKIASYGENVCTYYVENKISNSILKIFTIYSIPSKDYLANKIQTKNYKIESFDKILSNLPEISDQIGIEFHMSNYLTYMLEKYSIEEVISCPKNIEWNKDQLR